MIILLILNVVIIERILFMPDIILKTKDLTKKYQNKTVVDALNLEVKKGEIFGLLGPNGAGKSTTMNMICSINWK